MLSFFPLLPYLLHSFCKFSFLLIEIFLTVANKSLSIKHAAEVSIKLELPKLVYKYTYYFYAADSGLQHLHLSGYPRAWHPPWQGRRPHQISKRKAEASYSRCKTGREGEDRHLGGNFLNSIVFIPSSAA